MTVQLRHGAADLARQGAIAVAPAEIETEIHGGLGRGTVVMTAGGEVPVEALRPGDRLVTRERGTVVLKSVTPVDGPVCVIAAGSLGRARPDRDTVVAADQHIALPGGDPAARAGDLAFVPAGRLRRAARGMPTAGGASYRLDFGAPLTIRVNNLDLQVGRTEADAIALPGAV